MHILRCSEIRQLAFEIARDHPDFDQNTAYHKHVHSWARARGGAEVGAWDAWRRGWTEGLHIHMERPES